MIYKISYTLLTVIGLISLRILGITNSVIGSLLIAGSLILGVILCGLRKNHAMLAFTVAFLLMATRTTEPLALYTCVIVAVFSVWAWNKNQATPSKNIEEIEENQ